MAGSSVRAAVLRAPGAAVEVVGVLLADPRAGEVEVAITAAGGSRLGRARGRRRLGRPDANQRILGSDYGSVDPQRDNPRLVDRCMDEELDFDALVSGRRPLEEAAAALDDLAAGRTLRTLLMTGALREGNDVHSD